MRKLLFVFIVPVFFVACYLNNTQNDVFDSSVTKTLFTELKKKDADYNIVAKLIDMGADVNATDENDYAPLNWAVLYKHEKIVELLLSKGAYVDRLNSSKMTPLMYASLLGYETIVESLLKNGAQANREGSFESYRNAFDFAAMGSHEKVIDILIEKTPNPKISSVAVEIAYENKADAIVAKLKSKSWGAILDPAIRLDSFLLLAQTLIVTDDSVLTKFLIEEKGEPVDWKDNNNNTLVHSCVQYNRAKSLKVLIEKKVELNAKDDKGNAPIHLAVKDDSKLEVLKLLLNAGADKELVDKSKETPLAIAFDAKAYSAVALLIDHGASISESGKDSKELLAEASVNGNIPLLKTLLKQMDVNTPIDKGTTALMIAAGNNKIQAVNMLIQAGADVNLADKKGNTALQIAVSENMLDAAIILLDKSNVTKEQAEKFLLQIADSNPQNQHPEPENFVKALIAKGADINSTGEHNETALHNAAYKDNAQLVRALIDNGADISLTVNSKTSFQLAVENKTYNALAVFVEKTDDIKAIDNNTLSALVLDAVKPDSWFGPPNFDKVNFVSALIKKNIVIKDFEYNQGSVNAINLLHIAATGTDAEMIGLLVKAGVDVNAKNSAGETPLGWGFFDKDSNKHDLVLAELVRMGSSSFFWETGSGITDNTLMHFAAENGLIELANAILARDDFKNLDMKNAKNSNGQKPIELITLFKPNSVKLKDLLG